MPHIKKDMTTRYMTAMKGKIAWLVTRYPAYNGEFCEPILILYTPQPYQYATEQQIVYFEVERAIDDYKR